MHFFVDTNIKQEQEETPPVKSDIPGNDCLCLKLND